MTIINTAVALAAVSCATLVWTRGDVFKDIKSALINAAGKHDKFVAMLVYCAMCSGFWFGVVSYVFLQPELLGKPWWMELPLWACMVSISSIAIDKAIWE